jgi:SAM-dependent methyltransferase
LARLGWVVDAVDISLVGLAELRRRAERAGVRVNLIAADLDRFVVRPASYDLVVQTFLLKRRLLPRLRQWVRPGGYLFVETHLRTAADRAGGRYAVRSGELEKFAAGWEVLAFLEGDRPEGEHRFATAALLARRPVDEQAAAVTRP